MNSSNRAPIIPQARYWRLRRLTLVSVSTSVGMMLLVLIAGGVCYYLRVESPMIMACMMIAISLAFCSSLVYGISYVLFVREKCPACGLAIHSNLIFSNPFSSVCIHCDRPILHREHTSQVDTPTES